jgi:hypothetical protein
MNKNRFSIVKVLLIFAVSLSFISLTTAAEIDVPAGADAISAAMAGASTGDELVLSTDGGAYTETGAVTVDKAVTIRPAIGLATPPVWTTGGDSHIDLKSDLTLQGIVLDGVSNPDTAESAIVNNAATPNDLTIDGCEFRGFTGKTITTEGAALSSFNSVEVSNCLFHSSGAGVVLDGDHPQGAGQHADNIPGAYGLSVDNSTFYNLDEEGIKLEAYMPPGDPAVASIEYVTIYNCGAEAIYLKEIAGSSEIKNNVITDCDIAVTIKYSPSDVVITYSNIWNNSTDYKGSSGGGCSAGIGVISHDPWYADPDNGDFNFAWSELTRRSSEQKNVGDNRWGKYKGGPPRLAVNTLGPGSLQVGNAKDFYTIDEVVTLTAVPDEDATFIGWIGDTTGTANPVDIKMSSHNYVTAQFAPKGAIIEELSGTFSSKVDWSMVAVELKERSEITYEESQSGSRLELAGPLEVTTDAPLTAVAGDVYLAAISTKGFSHGHAHNKTKVDSIWGLDLEWKNIASQCGTRNSTHLEIYAAQGIPSGDGPVSAIVSNFPAGFCVVLSVTRYSGVDRLDAIGNVLSHNTAGFNGPVVEITGYPRPASSYDIPEYSMKFPISGSGVCAFIAHRSRIHDSTAVGFTERFYATSHPNADDGNENSITVLDKLPATIEVLAGTDAISAALAGAKSGDVLSLASDGGAYSESSAIIVDKYITISAAEGLAVPPTIGSDDPTAIIQIKDNLTLEGVILDGSLGSAPTTNGIKAEGNDVKSGYNLSVNGCEFNNFLDVAGKGSGIAGDPETEAESITITDSKFQHIGSKAIKFDDPVGHNIVNSIGVENCTFWDMGSAQEEGYGIYVEAVDLNTPLDFLVDHVTLHDFRGGKGVYPKKVDGAVIKNSVTTDGADVGIRIYGTNSVVQNCMHSDCAGGIGLKNGATTAQTTNIVDHDPWYANPDSGDFDFGWSQLTKFGTDQDNAGDTRWGRYTGGPPRLALNAIGPGKISANPAKVVYDAGDVVTITATPDAGATLVTMLGDTLDASNQIVMHAHRYVSAQFAPAGATIEEVSGTFNGIVDWSAVAMEMKAGSNVTIEELVNGGILESEAPNNTLTVTSDANLKAVDDALYLAIISTKSFSHGHSHNTQVVDDVSGLGLTWTHVATQRASRNSTVLNIYKAQGKPTGDGQVSATLHNFPAGFVIALTVIRFSGVDATAPIGNIVSHNTIGFGGPGVEITGYPRPDKRKLPEGEVAKPDADAFSVKLPLGSAGASVLGIIAHRNNGLASIADGFALADTFKVEASGNTNSITVIVKNIIDADVDSDISEVIPQTFALFQNYPNPFNPETEIKYQLPKSCEVKLTVYNMMGQQIATLYEGKQNAGTYTAKWNGMNDLGQKVSSGVYIYKLRAAEYTKSTKMLFIQ